MLQKIKLFLQLIKNMGTRYVAYRVFHEVEKRSGLLKRRHPQNFQSIFFIPWEQWKVYAPAFLFDSRENLNSYQFFDQDLIPRINHMKEGKFRFFYSEEILLGQDYDWVTHPITRKKFPKDLHWSMISDFDPEIGDIKYVWEKSRFTYLLDFIRFDQQSGEDHAFWVKCEILNWIENNPINSGPNWRCSQEISLRIINWFFAIYYYRNSQHFNEEFWGKVQSVLYWSLHHVYHHINFSRVAVRNNHAITETLFLALSELMFPFIPETKKWASKGRKWFEEEIQYQVYEDGTFLQFSMNYHRVVIQLLTLGIRMGEIHGKPFSKTVYEKAYSSLKFLFICQDSKSGFLPNYGANDGALFFPLSPSKFRDYRSQLDALYFILTGQNFYLGSKWEDQYWWCQKYKKSQFQFQPIQREDGVYSFETGGYYVIRDKESLTFLRCGTHKDRPQQADNLHLDIWVNGENILLDSGTYKYNCDKDLKENFEGTIGHNTVTLEKKSQMLKGSRFIWFYWTKSLGAELKDNCSFFEFEGKISAFRFLFGNCIHIRSVRKIKGKNEWQIHDSLKNIPFKSEAFQVWNFEDFSKLNFHLSPEFNFSSESIDLEKGFFSEHYGQMKSIHRLYLPLHFNSIHTTLVYKPE